MNFFYCFQSEWIKRKRSLASWLVILGGIFIPAIIFIEQIVKGEKLIAELKSPLFWKNIFSECWEPTALFILPMGIILSTSLIAQLEYKNNSWKQVHTTPQRLSTIFLAKYAVVLTMMVQFFLIFNIGILLVGIIPSIIYKNIPFPSEPIPFLYFLKTNIGFFITCLPIIALQYLLSIKYKNFFVSIGSGLLLLVASLFALSVKYGFIMPYSYSLFYFMKIFKNAHQIPEGINIHWLAITYFIIFSVAGLIFYVTKKEKG